MLRHQLHLSNNLLRVANNRIRLHSSKLTISSIQESKCTARQNVSKANEMMCCNSVREAKEAFDGIEIELINELYEQSNRNKMVLFEMCMNLANPEQADPEALRQMMQQQ